MRSGRSIHFVPSLRRDTIDRPRLHEALLTPNGHARLVLVQGPAGCGKTTVLSQWALSGSPGVESIVWVTLSDEDHRRMTVWERVILAIQDAGLAPRASPLMRFDTATLAPVTLRLNLFRLFSSVDAQLCVVLDDYHVVRDSRVDEDIIALLEGIPQLRFAIGSRKRSLLNRVETAARVETVVHDARTFAFTLAETELLLRGRDVDANELAGSIHRASEGWPLATRALLVEAEASAQSGEGTTLTSLAGHRSRFVEEYVESILHRSTGPGQRLLLHSALCLDVTVELAAALGQLDLATAAEHLEALERDGIATKRELTGSSRYAFHPLVLSRLRSRAFEILPPDEVVGGKRRYAEWLETERPEKAFSLLCEIRDLDDATAVLSRNFATLTSLHADSTLAALAAISIEESTPHPLLLSARLMLEYSNPATPRSWLEHWYSLITAETARQGTTGKTSRFDALALLTGMHRMMGNAPAANASSAALVDKLADPASREVSRIRNSVPLVHAVVAFTALCSGRFDVADAHYALNEADAAALGLGLDELRGRNGRALVAAVSGRIDVAGQRIRESRTNEHHVDVDEHFGGLNLRIAQAWTAIEELDLDEARSQLRSLVPYEAVLETWPFIALAAARLDLLTIGPSLAYHRFAATLAQRKKRPIPVAFLLAELEAMHALLAQLAGQDDPTASIDSSESADSIESPALLLTEPQRMLARGDDVAALALAKAASATIRHEHPQHFRHAIGATLIEAVAAHRTGHSEAADAHTEHALAMLHTTGLMTPLLAVPREDLEALFQRADASGPRSRGSAQALLSALPEVHTRPQQAPQLSPAERRTISALRHAGSVSGAAEALFLSVNTIKSHLKRAYKKLGVSTAQEAFAFAAASGQLDAGPDSSVP